LGLSLNFLVQPRAHRPASLLPSRERPQVAAEEAVVAELRLGTVVRLHPVPQVRRRVAA